MQFKVTGDIQIYLGEKNPKPLFLGRVFNVEVAVTARQRSIVCVCVEVPVLQEQPNRSGLGVSGVYSGGDVNDLGGQDGAGELKLF